ncbi:cobaltochelatase subunit CobN, partial [Candidatus Mycalebacterium sp.]
APADIARKAWNYFSRGGEENCKNFLKLVFNGFFGFSLPLSPPEEMPDIFSHDISAPASAANPFDAKAAILAYRSHYLSGNLSPARKLAEKLAEKGFSSCAVFVKSLREAGEIADLSKILSDGNFDLILNTTSFALKGADDGKDFIFEKINVPVIQTVFASSSREIWRENLFGLSPTDIAINISLPEIDGKIDSGPVSFKQARGKDSLTDSEIVRYAPYEDGCARAAVFARTWLDLARAKNPDKKIAIVMPNYPSRDGRLANGVGLDTPESCALLLKKLSESGYETGSDFPETGARLMEILSRGVTNDPDFMDTRDFEISLPFEQFRGFYSRLAPEMRERIEGQWGKPEDDFHIKDGVFPLPGVLFGNVFVSIQPERGYGQDTKAVYHSPDIPPPFRYLAFYFWLSKVFGASAVVHLGKHGNLEWLPGKSVALDPETCFPAAVFPPVPHFYPFIVNDPGEGTQAKRRAHAVIIDHLVPPMVRADSYGDYSLLEQLMDEYYQAWGLDPARAEFLKGEITGAVERTRLYEDLDCTPGDLDEVLTRLDAYLCDIKESQIRGGLHILGQCPEGDALAETVVALHRIPSSGVAGITQALADDLGLGFDPLDCDYGAALGCEVSGENCRTFGAATEALEKTALEHVATAIETGSTAHIDGKKFPKFLVVVRAAVETTFPRLSACTDEIGNLISGLEGRYVPSGPSGAPTRGKPDVLPTGRNFHSLDTRGLPTRAAYELGRRSADALIKRHIQENGDYPSSVGISVWGTSTMRTGGDDIAQAFALMGLRPVWRGESGRVVDFEVLSLTELGRPRVDVTLRISGFFRDAFPELISLFNSAVEKVALMDDEPEDLNPLRSRHLREKSEWIESGLDGETAQERSLYRVFGSKPGSYGAGLQSAIDSKNWSAPEDLAMIYVNWSGYAYGKNGPKTAHETYRRRLACMEVVLQNQDNREHDILDSDDYYQFHGGMANASRSERGTMPAVYFGDHSKPENPKIKTLKEEILKVYRSRVVNPKWIEGMRRHGYKGAFEMAATVDYLFGYDATTDVVDDFVYEGVAQAYLFDGENLDFLKNANPRAAAEMAERILEAAQRGMWKNPAAQTLEKLREVFTEAEAVTE